MVGNAEPGKEYNYRPLSKLCECQLDVNDQVSDKGARGGRARRGKEAELQQKARDRQTEEGDGRQHPHWTFMELNHRAPGARKRFKALAVGPVLHVPRFSS